MYSCCVFPKHREIEAMSDEENMSHIFPGTNQLDLMVSSMH